MTEPTLTKARLYALRGMYLFMAVGLALTVWPSILRPDSAVADEDTVILALLGAIGLLSVLGLRYPLKMLPLLMFEFLWKVIWIVAFALRMWLDAGLDEYAAETLFACLLGVVLVPIVMPWGYLSARFLRAPAE